MSADLHKWGGDERLLVQTIERLVRAKGAECAENRVSFVYEARE